MALAAKPVEEEATDLVVMATVDPVKIFTDRQQYSQFYEKLKAETDKLVPDVSSKSGRGEIRRLASKVTRAKTTLERAGLQLTKQWRRQTAEVTAIRKEMVAELDQLAAQVRKPLTDWEEAEQARIAGCEATIQRFRDAAIVTLDDTSETVRARGNEIWEIQIDDAEFGDLADQARDAKATAVATLHRALERLTREEAERAELERLRAADAERQEREQAAAQRDAYVESILEHITQCGLGMIGGKTYPYAVLMRELEEKVVVDEETFGDRRDEVERHRVATLERLMQAFQRDQEKAAAREEEERRAAALNAAQEAEERARREEQQRAEEAGAEKERQHEAALAEERRQREEAERIAREERERRERDEAERAERERLAAEEQARREADRQHRQRIQTAAKQAIMTCGVDEETAQKIVLAIMAGEIPAVTLSF